MDAEARLARDHKAIDGLLREAFAALEAGDATRSHTALDRAWMRLAVHIRAEHKALFPGLLSRRPELGETILGLRADHDAFMDGMARLLPRLKAGLPDFQAIAMELRRLEDRLQIHNRLEEAAIYPAAGTHGDLAARVESELAFLPDRYKA